MKFKNLVIVALLLLPLSNTFGQWKFSGSAGPYLNSLNFSSTSVAPAQKAGVASDLKLENKFTSSLRFKSDIGLRNDVNAKDDVESFQLLPKNFYLQKKISNFTFRLGLQTLSIDGPDVLNPADVVHAKNWIDPTSPLTVGSTGLAISQEIDEWNWEVFYVPKQTTPILPGEHSPWLPRRDRLSIESDNTEMKIPKDVKYKYLSSKEIQGAQDNNVTFKLQRKTEKLETQFLYHDGLSQTPFLLIDANATLLSTSPTTVLLVDSPVRLRPLYYRQQVVAGTFVIPLDIFVIRGGANWIKPKSEDDRTPTETRTGVLGIEKSLETRLGMVTGILQYIRQESLSQNQISFLRSIFENAWTAGLRVPFGEETSFLMGGLYDVDGRSSTYQASVNHRLTNSWSFEGGAKFLQGPKETLIGLYDRHDSFQLKTIFSW